MTSLAPRCGRPVRRKEQGGVAVLPDEDPACGRPEGHSPPCRSRKAVERAARRHTGSAADGAVIRLARVRAGYSQQVLAGKLGVSQRAVSGYEKGRISPSPERWVQLELALGPLGAVRERAAAAAGGGGQREEAAA